MEFRINDVQLFIFDEKEHYVIETIFMLPKYNAPTVWYLSTVWLLSKNFNKKDPLEVGIKSGKARRGTGSAEKTPAKHTRHFQGQVTPPPRGF